MKKRRIPRITLALLALFLLIWAAEVFLKSRPTLSQRLRSNFAGGMDLASRGANLLDARNRKGVFLSAYLQSIAEDAGRNDSSFSFDF